MTDIHPVGDAALLLDLESNAAVHRVAAAARERWRGELADVVPGHRTVLLVFRRAVPDSAALISELHALAITARPEVSGKEHPGAVPSETLTIPVHYDGADLGAVAQELGIGEDEVVALHSGGDYTVAFMGFAPGFPYLIEDTGSGAAEALLGLARLATPRTEVPAGSVAVAAGYCGIYPRSSPGGWNLLGHTELALFDAESQPPALLTPGTRVRFSAVEPGVKS